MDKAVLFEIKNSVATITLNRPDRYNAVNQALIDGIVNGLNKDLREIKKNKDFSSTREEILEMIWDMEEEIMGKEI